MHKCCELQLQKKILLATHHRHIEGMGDVSDDVPLSLLNAGSAPLVVWPPGVLSSVILSMAFELCLVTVMSVMSVEQEPKHAVLCCT